MVVSVRAEPVRKLIFSGQAGLAVHFSYHADSAAKLNEGVREKIRVNLRKILNMSG